jgi:EpsI family protein
MIDRRFTAICFMLVGTAALSAMSERRHPQSLVRPLEAISPEIGEWQTTGHETLGAEILNVLKPTSYLSRYYRGVDTSLGLFIAFYDHQTAGATLHSPKHCLPGTGWEIWKQSSYTVPLATGPVTINRYSVRHGEDKTVIYYWYQSEDRIVASELAGKVFLVRDSLISGKTAAALVRVTVPDTPTADREVEEFAKKLIPEISLCFGKQSGSKLAAADLIDRR